MMDSLGVSSVNYLDLDTDNYNSSFFPQWNGLPESVICSAEIADDCVAKFTSLTRPRN